MFFPAWIRTFATHGKNNNVKQAKIFSKLVGGKISGSKKKFYPTSDNLSHDQKHFNIVKPQKQGKNTNRRVKVLNKIFMTHISDLLATGQASNHVVGRGLQILGVRVNPDFSGVNVHWIAGDDQSKFLEEELAKCSGYLRHELSQLRLMGEVPKIHFVKDKNYAISSEVERVMNTPEFGSETSEDWEQIENDFNLHSKQEDDEIPEMRHDVLGLDHSKIMLQIHTKLKKSKMAWELHEMGMNAPPSQSQLPQNYSKLIEDSEGLSKFIAKRQIKAKIDKRKYRDDSNFSQFSMDEKGISNDFENSKDDDFIDENYEKDYWKK